MSRKLERRYWEENVSINIETKKVNQIYVDTELGVNRWLKNNPNVEVVDINMSANEAGEIVMVVYKIELEESE